MGKAHFGLVVLFLLIPLAAAQEGFRKIGVAESKDLKMKIDVFANDAFSKRVTLTDFKLLAEKSETSGDLIAFHVVCTAVLKSKDDLGLRYAPYNAKGLSLGGPRIWPSSLKPGEKTQVTLGIDRDVVKDTKAVKFFVE